MNTKDQAVELRQEAKDKLRHFFEESGYELYLSGSGDELNRIVDCIIAAAVIEAVILQREPIQKVLNR
jgi:hypothetical protein